MLIHTMCLQVSDKVKWYSYPRNRPWRPIGLWDVKDPTLSRQSAQMAARLSAALHTGRDILPRNINFLVLILISVTGWVNPRALCGMMDYANWTFIHPNGSRTRNLSARSMQPYSLRYSVPQCTCVLMVTKMPSSIRKEISNFQLTNKNAYCIPAEILWHRLLSPDSTAKSK
jgi:hypothetical protein